MMQRLIGHVLTASTLLLLSAQTSNAQDITGAPWTVSGFQNDNSSHWNADLIFTSQAPSGALTGYFDWVDENFNWYGREYFTGTLTGGALSIAGVARAPHPVLGLAFGTATTTYLGTVNATGDRIVNGSWAVGTGTWAAERSIEGAAYCFGLSASCECDNEDLSAGCSNSNSVGASLVALTGTASLAADDLELRVFNLPASTQAVLFSGTTQTGVLLGDGQRCVGGSLTRFPLQTANLAGTFSTSVGLASSGGFVVGQTAYFQVWYRDPSGPCGKGSNLSNAYQVQVTL